MAVLLRNCVRVCGVSSEVLVRSMKRETRYGTVAKGLSRVVRGPRFRSNKTDGKLPKTSTSSFFIKSKFPETMLANAERNKELFIKKEDVMTIPNLLCITRIMLSPGLAVLVVQQQYDLALAIFVFAGFTDLLDGLIARNFPSQRSMLGSFLDPMADKLLVSTLFLSLTAVDLIPVQLTLLVISRDVCLMLAGFYIRYVSLPTPKTLSRYFDVTHATAKLKPTMLSKINTSLQLSLVALTLGSAVLHLSDHPFLHAMWYLTAATTFASGLTYVFSKDSVKILSQIRHTRTIRKRNSPFKRSPASRNGHDPPSARNREE